MASDWNTPPSADELAAIKADPWALPPTAQEAAGSSPGPPPSAGEAFRSGMTKGIGDRLLARADALKAQKAPLPQDLPTPSMAEQLLGRYTPQRPVDEGQLEADRVRILQGRRDQGAAGRAAHPVAYGAGMMVPAVATMAVPGGATVKGAAAISGLLGGAGSESDNPGEVAGEAVLSTVLGGGIAKGLQVGGRMAGSSLAPKVKAIYDRIMTQIADRSSSAADATLRSATGTLGKATAAGSADLKLLQFLQEQGVSPELQQKIAGALSGPEAAALRESLGTNAAERLPDALGRIEGARGLVEQAGADAAAARTPEAIAATEQSMRGEVLKRLLTRYAAPAAVGYGVDKASGGSGALGALAGFGARPMLRATARGLGSPAFRAPLVRALMGMSSEGAGRLAPAAEAEVEPRVLEILRALQQKSSPATLADASQQ